MNINIYLEDDLAKSLNYIAKESHQTRNAIVREAIKEWIVNHREKKWPTAILKFKGISGFPGFESYRSDFDNADEDPFK